MPWLSWWWLGCSAIVYIRQPASFPAQPTNEHLIDPLFHVIFQDTIQTCFGTKELPPEDTGLPNCVDVQHMNSYYLNKTGKGSIIRILTCFAYNHPDLQYSPMLYPIASIIRHFLTGM